MKTTCETKKTIVLLTLIMLLIGCLAVTLLGSEFLLPTQTAHAATIYVSASDNFAEKFKQLNNDDTIVLTDDEIYFSTSIEVNKKITLDLNDHILIYQGMMNGYGFVIQPSGELTILGGSGETGTFN